MLKDSMYPEGVPEADLLDDRSRRVWHPFRVRMHLHLIHAPGVSLRSTPGYPLATLWVARKSRGRKGKHPSGKDRARLGFAMRLRNASVNRGDAFVASGLVGPRLVA